MTRRAAIENIMYLVEGHDSGDYLHIYNKCIKFINGKNVRFSKWQKEMLCYKFENMMLTNEEIQALEIITGCKDSYSKERKR